MKAIHTSTGFLSCKVAARIHEDKAKVKQKSVIFCFYLGNQAFMPVAE
jgi:hypothetical protein